MARINEDVAAADGCQARPCNEVSKRQTPWSRIPPAAVVEAREYVWLDDVRRGISIREVANREGLSIRRVQLGVTRARLRDDLSRKTNSRNRDFLRMMDSTRTMSWGVGARGDDPERSGRQPPQLIPLFPIGPFTPRSTCPHHGPIRRGSAFCCMVCFRSGMDDHPALQRNPRTDPRPDPKPSGPAPAAGRETRKQRRQRLFSARRAAARLLSGI
jgi:hypothetical protein